jgi:protein-S-isoprenylcysteine O-methyltransferase Ste14
MTMSETRSAGTAPQAQDNAGVVMRPPLLFLLSIATGVALELLRPLPVIPASLERALGIPLLLLGIALLAWGATEFTRRGTNVPTNLPSLRIVRSGPYRFSRNPIYVGFFGIQLGIALWVNGGWLLLTLAAALLVLRFGVIAREERYLERKFGARYRAYQQRVRRWL